jgi:trimeric autotransporter adhesin
MKTILTIFLSILLAQSTSISQMTYVPDDNFEKALINRGYDEGPLNDSVPTANIIRVAELYVNARNISDLTGIEEFKALENLDCGQNDLTNLDLSNITKLKHLDCSENSLTSLVLTNNTELRNLTCSYNQLTSLDLSNNIELLALNGYHNQLTSLDVSNNTKLSHLGCASNQLTSLDVSNNTELNSLWCAANQLTNLDVSNNTSLMSLHCGTNQLTSLDVSNNTKLRLLYCNANTLTSLDVSNNTKLKELRCYANQLTSLDLKNGNNKNMNYYDHWSSVELYYNPDLVCIQVDDSAASANYENWRKDSTAHYSEDCGYTDVEDYLLIETEISVFPNPANTSFVVQFELEDPRAVVLSLSDILGNSVQVKEIPKQLNISENFDVSHLPAGVYFLNFSVGGHSTSRKVLVE